MHWYNWDSPPAGTPLLDVFFCCPWCCASLLRQHFKGVRESGARFQRHWYQRMLCMDVPAPPKAWAGPQGAQMLQGTWVQCQRRFCWMRAIGTCWEEGEAGWNTHLCLGFAAGNCPWEAGSAARSAPSQQRKEERRSLLHAHGRSKPQHQEAPPRCAGFSEPRSPPFLQRGWETWAGAMNFPKMFRY